MATKHEKEILRLWFYQRMDHCTIAEVKKLNLQSVYDFLHKSIIHLIKMSVEALRTWNEQMKGVIKSIYLESILNENAKIIESKFSSIYILHVYTTRSVSSDTPKAQFFLCNTTTTKLFVSFYYLKKRRKA